MARRRTKVVEVNDFAQAVNEVIGEYYSSIADRANMLVAETAVEAAQELKRTSPRRPQHGEYADGWYIRQNKKRKDSCELEIANHVYQLTHLLEHGHLQNVHGTITGFTEAQPHIKPVEDKAINTLLRGLIKIVR